MELRIFCDHLLDHHMLVLTHSRVESLSRRPILAIIDIEKLYFVPWLPQKSQHSCFFCRVLDDDVSNEDIDLLGIFTM